MNNFATEVKKMLKEAGCFFLRDGRGDHEIWQCPNGLKVTVDHKIKSRHTANGILKRAGLPKGFK